MANTDSRTDPETPERAGNPLDRQRELMELLSQETRHSILQTLLGHPHCLASADEINYYVTDRSRKTVEEQLDRLIEADILTVLERPKNMETRGLPWQFYGFTEYAITVLDEFNYLKGVPMARAVHQQTRKTEKIERHQNAPRPDLDPVVRTAFRLDEDGDDDSTEETTEKSSHTGSIRRPSSKSADGTQPSEPEPF